MKIYAAMKNRGLLGGNDMIIGIDHGNGFIKTKNNIFAAGVAKFKTPTPINKDVVYYNGAYYQTGVAPEGLPSDKTSSEDYYIMTLAAVALEMRKYGIITSDVTLATGLPFTRYGAEKEEFIKYLGQNKHVEFKYEDTSYSININPNIYVFPQGYAAIVSKLPSIKGSCFLIDIGTGTTEILPISGEGRIDLKRAYTMQWGINNCFTMINETISQEYQTELSQDQIIDIMLDRESGISPKIKELVIAQIKRWCEETFRQLHSRKVNYEFVPSFFMGGGAGLINRYSENQPEMITFIDDIRANAAGYELLANSVEKRGKK